MKVKLTKLREAPDPLHPNNIKLGYVWEHELHPDFEFREPKEGESFKLVSGNGKYIITSVVMKIIDSHTFLTLNSVYQWEIIES